MSGGDWRQDSFCMKTLLQKLHSRPESVRLTDITFKLPDGSIVGAHKLILALASPFFEAQFFGLLATEESQVVVKNVESSSFRKVLDFIYCSGEVDWTLDNLEYWNLLQAAHLYLVPGLIKLCNIKLSNLPTTITNNNDLIEHINRAAQLCIYEGILSSGLSEIKARLESIINTDLWNLIDESVVLEILDDNKLKVSEGALFKGMTEWCKVNTPDTQAAINKFQDKFASKLKVTNMTKDTFLSTIGKSELISDGQFKAWTFEFMNSAGITTDETRFALNPLKIQQTTIESVDFLEPRVGSGVRNEAGDQIDCELWKVVDEYPDVNINIRIFQKVAETGTAGGRSETAAAGPRSKFGILLETIHKAKANVSRSAITERVSVKMVAKKQDGTVVKKLFKPIEDSNKEGAFHRSNIFVLSKNKEERTNWHVMEIVVIIDRRPTCHIKGISGEEFAKTVCVGQTQNYLSKAVSLHYDVNSTIKNAVEDIAKRLGVNESPTANLSQWLYIFTKGYVSNLRSRRAIPNDYWTAETVEDYMRCKVINFPIGVHNEAMRRDAFRTWIISRRVADDKEKDKKNVFVCTYAPDVQEVKFLKTLSLPVETKVETLGLLEHISLGSVKVNEKFFEDVTLGVEDVTLGVQTSDQIKIFIRRIFPIQNDTDCRVQRVLVTEAVLGSTLTHIDDCHVLVVQTHKFNSDSLDFDKFLLMKIREVEVTCISKENHETCLTLRLDPASKKSDIVLKLSLELGAARNMIEIYKCYSGKTITDRCADPHIRDDDDFESMFQYCETEKKIFYANFQDTAFKPDQPDTKNELGGVSWSPQAQPRGVRGPAEAATSSNTTQPLEEGAQEKGQEKWIDDMDTA